MDTTALRTRAALLCVAVNAVPLIAERLLLGLDATGLQKDMVDVLEAHGGDRFGERDNSSELAILEAWLGETVGGELGAHVTPSLYELLKMLWLRLGLDLGLMIHIDAGECHYSSARQFEGDLGRRWTEKHHDSSAPSVLIVKTQIPASVICTTTTLDLYDHMDADTKRHRQIELGNARKQCDAAKAILCSVGIPRLASSCAEITESLRALNRWAESPEAAAALATQQSAQNLPLPTDTFALMAQENIWESIAERINRFKAIAQGRRDSAERTERYVLRAFVVDNTGATDSSGRKVSIVRRFGKSNGQSHYSVLDVGAGTCQPMRAQDIKGTVVESMWACCNDDSECKNSSAEDDVDANSQGGLNTVVADPDDEIFCRLCHDLESWGYNQIIICDGCELGVHQMCHAPIVTESDLTLDQWYCSNCTRADRSKTDAKRQRTD
ncbi:mitochondrial transcription factor 2 [Coemansia sp. RSA 2399]|nr:mitochondrial transcription factor 2 [Coemansia sp. RSA 2399]